MMNSDQDSNTKSDTASVTVESDRIAFLSDRNDGQWELYVMDMDGNDLEQLTTNSIKEYGYYSYSPDGSVCS